MARVFVVSPTAVLALTSMDPFCESDLFDDDVPLAPPPGEEAPTDPLRVPADGVSLHLHGRRAMRFSAYVVAVLVVILAGEFVLRLTGQPSGHYAHHPSERHHHHLRSKRARRQTLIRHRVTVAPSPAAVDSSQTVVGPPSSAAERPTRDRSVGIVRPNSAPPVGNTEQFAYLGR